MYLKHTYSKMIIDTYFLDEGSLRFGLGGATGGLIDGSHTGSGATGGGRSARLEDLDDGCAP